MKAVSSRPGLPGETWVAKTLPGGLRVVLETIPYVRSVSVGVWVGVGSRQEPPELTGISHVVEHLLFKGTHRRTARRIAEEIDSIGGLLNGYTAKEYSCYYLKVLDSHVERAMDLLSDIVLRPRFDPEDLKREKDVILEEIDLYEDAPDELVSDLLSLATWGEVGLGRSVLGSKAAVESLQPDTVSGYHGTGYRQARSVVAVAGNIDASKGYRLARRFFEDMPVGGERRPGPPPAFRPGFAARTKPIEQANVSLGFEGVSLDDPAIYDFHLLAGILGGGTSSRLFQTIREERGLAYSVFSYASPFSDTGLLGVYAGVGPDKVGEVLRLVAKEVRDLASNGPAPDELARAKDQMKASLLLGLESTSSRMSRLGRSLLLLGRILSPDEVTRRIDQVTADSLTTLARRVLVPERVALASVGPEGVPGEDGLRDALAG